MGTGGKWVCQARGQEGPSWLEAKGQAARQTPSGVFWRCFGGQGAGWHLVVVGAPGGFGPKWPHQNMSGGLEQGRCRRVSHPKELQER